MRLTILWILALTVSASAQSPAQMIEMIEGAQVPNRQGYDPYTLGEVMDRMHVPGLSVAVIREFKIDWAKGWGAADVETGTPVTPETMFQAASMSKPVAAMASLKAIQEGKFGLDQDINTVLKSWQLLGDGFTGGQPVTPRALMSHTSGTGDGFGFPGYPPGTPYAVGFSIEKDGEGWYFGHAGSNWGFQSDMIAHRLKGYGVVIMTNGDNGGALAQVVRRRVAQAYGWDTLDRPVLR